MERHVEFVAVAEVGAHVLRPLVGLGQQDTPRPFRLDMRPQPLDVVVRLRQVLAVGVLALEQVRHGIHAKPVDAHLHPEIDDVQHLLLDLGIVVVKVGLLAVEPVPVVLAGQLIISPVGHFGIEKNDARVLVALVGVTPHVPVALGRVF